MQLRDHISHTQTRASRDARRRLASRRRTCLAVSDGVVFSLAVCSRCMMLAYSDRMLDRTAAPCLRPDAHAACSSSVALLAVGPFREFALQTGGKHPARFGFTSTGVWHHLLAALVPMNAADLLVSTWDAPLVREVLAGERRVRPCATVCESFDDRYRVRLANGSAGGFRLIDGNLRFKDARETPHTIDFFYRRQQALAMVERVEVARARRYEALIMVRPDVVFVQRNASAGWIGDPSRLPPSTVYIFRSDHHRDSDSDPSIGDAEADPMKRGLCGQQPHDWFAYGGRESMGRYLSGFPRLPALYDDLRRVKGACDWWKCHNYRRNFSFLINGESLLGIHLRRAGLRCRDVVAPWRQPPIEMMLPPTRKRGYR